MTKVCASRQVTHMWNDREKGKPYPNTSKLSRVNGKIIPHQVLKMSCKGKLAEKVIHRDIICQREKAMNNATNWQHAPWSWRQLMKCWLREPWQPTMSTWDNESPSRPVKTQRGELKWHHEIFNVRLASCCGKWYGVCVTLSSSPSGESQDLTDDFPIKINHLQVQARRGHTYLLL